MLIASLVAVLAVIAVLYTVVRAVRWHLDRVRYEGWTREWQTFDHDDNGRRKNHRTLGARHGRKCLRGDDLRLYIRDGLRWSDW